MSAIPAATMFFLLLTLALPHASSDYDAGCLPGSADPTTVNEVRLPDGAIYYVEERNGMSSPTEAPMPGTGFLVGDGTQVYEETNGLEGLQRGSFGWCYPAQDPCLLTHTDPVVDENCGHGPDLLRMFRLL